MKIAQIHLAENTGKSARKRIIARTAGAWKKRQDLNEIIALRKNRDRTFN
ncbi:MAG: hypothetical protein WAX69_01480 [Victivallales bacterium]